VNRFVVILVGLASSTLQGKPAPCAACHEAEVGAYSHTHMALAMVAARESGFRRHLLEQPLRESRDGYVFVFKRIDNAIVVSTQRGNDHAEGTIEWVAGAGAQGETPLIRTSDAVLESRVSYFSKLDQFGITLGHNAGASRNAKEALGMEQDTRDLRNCLNCHASNVSSDLKSFTPGVQCVRCHPGADLHAEGKEPPLNPGKLSGPDQVRFCGQCHRNKPLGNESEIANVRFQPFRLAKSRCFASGALSCTACHPAHQDAKRNADAFYNAKCNDCHVRGFHSDSRQSGNCVSCHMPRMQLHPALTFTDHFIRVLENDEVARSLAQGKLVR
jgi:hypothetical protein